MATKAPNRDCIPIGSAGTNALPPSNSLCSHPLTDSVPFLWLCATLLDHTISLWECKSSQILFKVVYCYLSEAKPFPTPSVTRRKDVALFQLQNLKRYHLITYNVLLQYA